MMKSTLGKAVKPGASTLSMGKSNQASTIGGRRGGAEGGAGQADPDSRDKKKQEDMKQQKKEETSEERFMKVIICEEESTNLKRVFKLFVYEQQVLTKEGKGKKELGRKDQTRKDWNKKEGSQDGADDSRLGNVGKDPIESIDWFDSKAVRVILGRLGVKDIREQDIEIMIWEVDENLDGRVNEKEFELMYKKCIEDQQGLEPRNLFNLVQFLMFCKPTEDENGNLKDELDFRTEVKAEDTYFLIYGRIDRQEEARRKRMEDNRAAANGEILKLLQDEIKLIFRDPDARETDEHKNVDPEAMINYTTYLMRVNKQALLKRQEGKEKRKIMMKDAKDK